MEININGRKIGQGNKPFIIAEISANHHQSLERAIALVDAAKDAGVDALKLQTYTPETMTLNLKRDEFYIANEKSLWYGYSLYELYKKAYTPWEWHAPIFEHCRKCGLIPFSTPFDASAVDFLETLQTPLYKVASFENTDLALIRKIAATGKPMIISTGMANVSELDESVQIARDAGCKDLVLLKCTSAYPASPIDSNILTIKHMRDLFHCEIGLSDHTLGIGVALASIALGATVIEKHLILSRSEGGLDAAFSLEPAEMKLLVAEATRAWQALGKVTYGPTHAEQSTLVFRRTLYVVEDMHQGDVFSNKNVRAIRPGLGLPVKYYEKFLGKKASCDIKKGTPLNWHLI